MGSPGDLISDYATKSYLQQFYKQQTLEVDNKNNGKPQLPGPPSGEINTTRPGEASTDDDQSPKVTTVECGVCSEVVAPITFMPCGHSVVCLDCSSRMKKSWSASSQSKVKWPHRTWRRRMGRSRSKLWSTN